MLRLALMLIVVPCSVAAAEPQYAEIRVVDAATGRGVPMVELETVHGLQFVTDNAGRVAFGEPGLLNQEVFFSVKSHGYEVPKDGFGFRGVRVVPRVGQPVEIKIQRKNLAERLCRLTGEGQYRDTVLLGLEPPFKPSENSGQLVGQDSVQVVAFGGKLIWLWGDTSKIGYPLGLFRTAGATTPLLDKNFDPSNGIPFNYFVDAKTKFVRPMMPLPERPEGVIWLFSLCVVPDEKGVDQLVGYYTRRKNLHDQLEHGLAIFRGESNTFEVLKQLPETETWRKPAGHPITWEENGKKWLLFGSPNVNVRVPATLKALQDPEQYEAFTNARNKDGQREWRWQKTLPPMDSKIEFQLHRRKQVPNGELRYLPADASNPEVRVTLHSGTVRWNAYRKKWILLANQTGGLASHLGEVWYAEADAPTGPFSKAVRVVSHDQQTFYNVCHHEFLDREGGRFIHFEGTYTNEFAGTIVKTPRYNYNQILYKLDLSLLK